MSLALKMRDLYRRLSSLEDGSALVVFRVGFGLIMCYDMIRYGWRINIRAIYLNTEFHFKYLGFEWVQNTPGEGIVWHLSILAVLGFMIAVGLFYRWATVLFAIGFGWFFLIDRAQYLNHFYMAWLFSVLMCVVPAHRMWSLDVRWGRVKRSTLSPVWARWLLLAQLEIILIYAGLVKINPDWMNLAPLEQWLAKRDDMWLVGELFTQRWAVAVAAYGVIALHLVGAPLLLFKRTRVWVLCIYASFHSLNHFVFTIGIFPWMTLFTSLLCLEPDWPRTFWQWLSGQKESRKRRKRRLKNEEKEVALARPMAMPLVVFIGIWLAVQVLLPWRHFLYRGDVAWNDSGHLFSWRMKLRSKRGQIRYLVEDPVSGRSWEVNPRDFLTSKQVRKMVCRPDMVLQFGHYLADRWEDEYQLQNLKVFARNRCSLNYRAYAPQVDPTVDLTTISRTDSMAGWVLPLEVELPNRIIPWSR